MHEDKQTTKVIFKTFFKSLRFSNPLTVAFLCIILAGVVTMVIVMAIPQDWVFTKILQEIAVLTLTVTPILFIYEGVLKTYFHLEMKNDIKMVIDEAGIQKDILQIFKKTMPTSYKNLIDSGVSDAFPELDPGHLKARIRECTGEITILKMWIPYIPDSIDKKIIIDSILANCNYRIILCDPDTEDALIRRATAMTKEVYTAKDYKHSIIRNLKFFRSVWSELKKIGKEDKLEIRLHEGFLSTSLIGFSNYFIVGLYLNGRLANKGTQLKIDKDRVDGTLFFNHLRDHFELQWEHALREVVFSDTAYSVVERPLKTS